MRHLEANTAVLSIVGWVTLSAPGLAQVGDPAGTYTPPDHTAPAPGVEDPNPLVESPNGAYEETPATTRILVSGMIEKVMDADDNERLAIASPDPARHRGLEPRARGACGRELHDRGCRRGCDRGDRDPGGRRVSQHARRGRGHGPVRPGIPACSPGLEGASFGQPCGLGEKLASERIASGADRVLWVPA